MGADRCATCCPARRPAGFIAKLRAVLKDPALEIEVLEGSIPTGSSADTALMECASAQLQLDATRAYQ